jgi:[acyl-carrier-protein] S-malonyltransferase
LGEYAALVAAGALQFSEAVRLVNERAALMNAIADGSRGMLAVAGVDEVRIKQVLHCHEEVHIACFNSPDQLVLAGPLAQLKALGGALESEGGRCSMLNVSDAFHSPWMQPCAQRFAEHLERANWSAFDSTPVANVTGQPYPRERCKWPNLLTRQLQEPVRWAQICKLLYSQGVTHVLEISPRPVLSALARSVQPALVAMHLGSPVHLRQAQEFVTAAESGALDFVGRCLAKAACARNYLSAQEQFPTSWRSIYSHLMDKYTQAQEAPGENHEQLAAAALGFLRGVLDAKGVPLDEQRSSLQEIAWIAPYGLSNAMVSAE